MRSFLAHPDHMKNPPYRRIFHMVGVQGIEPCPLVPKTSILPIYYTPKNNPCSLAQLRKKKNTRLTANILLISLSDKRD